tara:strand:- start:918 stop:1217 length:300 start_codon:yes stop_codon:yes gene_type:complete
MRTESKVLRTNVELLLEEISISNRSLTRPSEAKFIADQAVHTGPYSAVIAITDAAIDVGDCDMSFIEGIVDFVLPKGVTIYGNFTSISLESGTVIAYKL